MRRRRLLCVPNPKQKIGGMKTFDNCLYTQDRGDMIHRAKLNNMKASVDNSAPQRFIHLEQNLKKAQKEEGAHARHTPKSLAHNSPLRPRAGRRASASGLVLTGARHPLAERYLEIEKHNGLLLSRLSKIAERKGVEGSGADKEGKALLPGEAHPITSKTFLNRKCGRLSIPAHRLHLCLKRVRPLAPPPPPPHRRGALAGSSWSLFRARTRPFLSAFRRCGAILTFTHRP